jgi:hypothetical protein
MVTASPLRPTLSELEDLLWRCVWTFVEAFLSAFVIVTILSSETGDVNLTGLQTLALAAVIGGGSAVFSVVKTFASNKLGTGVVPQAKQLITDAANTGDPNPPGVS